MHRRNALLALMSTLALHACDPSTVLAPPENGDPDPPILTGAQLQVIAGASQQGAVGAPLSEPLVVLVTSSEGAALPGISVLWAFQDGRGKSGTGAGSWGSVASTTSDAQGRASVQWELGTSPGEQLGAVRLGGEAAGAAPVIFSASALPGPAVTLEVAPSQATLTPVETLQFSVDGFDAFGNQASITGVEWSSNAPGVAVISPSGILTPLGSGSGSITAALGEAEGSAAFTVTPVSDPDPEAGSLAITQGNGQLGTVAQALGQPLGVRLLDADGQPMQGRPVAWALLSGAGSLTSSTTVTNGNGLAFNAWTLGSAVGAQSVRASVPELSPVTFSATAEAGPPATLEVSPAARTLDVGQTAQLSVSGIDGFGNDASTAGVVWSSSAPTIVAVSSSGRVTAVAAGAAQITAALNGVESSATVTVAAVAQQPGSLEIVQGNGQTGTVAQPLGQGLTVRLRDTGGDPMQGRTVTWSVLSGGGALSGAATVTDAAGLAEVDWTLGSSAGAQSVRATTATLPAVTLSATAQAGPPASLNVSPGARTLDPDETVQLSVSATDEFGNSTSTAGAAWGSSAPAVATVSSGGLVTAKTEGQATITASLGGTQDGAVMTVNAPPPPPPPPSGQTIFFQEGFEDSQFGSRGWYDNTSMTRTTSEKHSGSGSLEVRFNSGQELPTFGGSARHLVAATESMYVRYWVKYSSNWIGSGVGYHPHEFQILTNKDGQYTGPSSTYLTTYIETRHQGGAVRPMLAIGDRLNIDAGNIGVDLTGVTENRAVAGCNGNTDGYATGCYNAGSQWANEKVWLASGSSIPKNGWHLVEVYFEMNSIVGGVGIPDGAAQYWLDGSLIMDHQGVLFRTGANADMAFNQFLIAPYIGVGSPTNQTMWVDDLVVADRR